MSRGCVPGLHARFSAERSELPSPPPRAGGRAGGAESGCRAQRSGEAGPWMLPSASRDRWGSARGAEGFGGVLSSSEGPPAPNSAPSLPLVELPRNLGEYAGHREKAAGTCRAMLGAPTPGCRSRRAPVGVGWGVLGAAALGCPLPVPVAGRFGRAPLTCAPSLQDKNRKLRPLYDIPYMFEAREFLRKKLIGKKVLGGWGRRRGPRRGRVLCESVRVARGLSLGRCGVTQRQSTLGGVSQRQPRPSRASAALCRSLCSPGVFFWAGLEQFRGMKNIMCT